MEIGRQLTKLADDIAAVIPDIDAETTGQYGAGIGSEDEERQVELIFKRLQQLDSRYEGAEREVMYPGETQECDLVLATGVPIECKLIRYWRANGDPEHYMPMRIFSPFNKNTILTDAKALRESEFESDAGLLGLFYKRAEDDPVEVRALPERFTAENFAGKLIKDLRYWYDIDASICGVSHFSGLQHSIHKQGAAITLRVL